MAPSALARKLARLAPSRAWQHLLERLAAVERNWDEPARRARALGEARAFVREVEAAGVELPPGAAGDLGRRLARAPARHELLALIVPLERALDRVVRDADILPASDAPEPRDAPMPVRIVADSLRSAFNAGGVFRTAEFFGAEEVVLSGYSPDPADPRVARAAMGTDGRVAWSRCRTAGEALARLRTGGAFAVALETGPGHPPISALELRFPCALLVGNERFGLSPSVVAGADARACIPSFGAKGSLNVVAALAIALYELRRHFDAQAARPRGESENLKI
jgi:tRNA (guanosine-2'-O-)-methyltransferase